MQRLQARLAAARRGAEALQRSGGPAARAARQRRAGRGAPRLEVIQAQVGATVHLVPVDEVIYFEAADKYVRVVTADSEHLIRLSLQASCCRSSTRSASGRCTAAPWCRRAASRSARRDESGKVTLTLRGRPETLTASRLYAHLFKGM